MKKMIFFSLMVLFCGIANATVDCRPMSLISATNTQLVFGLPTSPSCDDPTYVIQMRPTGSGIAFTTVPATINSPSPGVFEATVSGLERCTEYDVLVEVYCDGRIEGGCVTGRPFETRCDPCEECFNFFGIEILESRECEYELVMDYAATGACGAISIISETWDFDHPGGTGSGFVTTHSFPGNGTYNVTATIVYATAAGDTCTAVQTRDIEVTDCLSCEDCFNFFGIEIVDSSECEFELVMDYAASGECGAITIISETWDFGHPGGTGSGFFTTHTFPSNGTYTVTGTIVYTTAALDDTCTAVQTRDIEVTDCLSCEDCFNFFGIEIVDSRECEYELVMDYAASGECGAITIISETWDFGHPGGTGSGFVTTHTFPGNGTYTVTGTIVYTSAALDDTCTAVQTREIEVTDCLSCEDCFNFFGIEIVDSRECEYELVMDYAASGECGAITIISETWDFGHPGGTGSGFVTTHTFPGNGTYTVTGTIVYTSAALDDTCTAVQTREIEVTDCISCEDCFNFYGIEVLSASGCRYELVMDYAASGECGAISIISETWDFGHPGGTGSGFYVTHAFPSNGTYTVTATIVYTAAGIDDTCTVVRTRTINVTGCGDVHFGGTRGDAPEDGSVEVSSYLNISAVPNPADNNVTITLADPNGDVNAEQLNIKLYDMNGRVVYQSTINPNAPKTIDISQFKSGVYIYEINDNASIMLKERLIVQ